MKFNKTWTSFKTLVTAKNLLMQYHEYDNHYFVFATETDTVEYSCELWKDLTNVKGVDEEQNSTDLQDFEDNYKANCNQPKQGASGHTYVEVSGGELSLTPQVIQVFDEFNIENNATLYDSSVATLRYSKKSIFVKNHSTTQGIIIELYASPNNIDWAKLETATWVIDANSNDFIIIDDFWRYMKLKVKKNAPSDASVSAWISGGI